MLSSSVTQEIKSRIDIVDFLAEYLQLKPAGTHNFRALCPFHNEKNPSFMVSRDKQFWHCFGCAKSGDIFTFLQDYEGLTFPEALKQLAERAGVKLVQNYGPSTQETTQKNKVLEILNLTAKYYHEYLLKSQAAQIARDYLIKRQIQTETIEQFNLGFSPDSWEEIGNFLRQRGYLEQDIVAAGLLIKSENKNSGSRQNKFYDRFRGRLMFPIADHNGAVVGFGARALKESEEKSAKYINSPQTLVYDKSHILYGLSLAKTAIKKQDLVVVVEGYLDVISSHQAGITNVVAVSGTALTNSQLKLLKRYSTKLALCFDADQAGMAAAKRGVETALAEGFEIKIITLPFGKDPDECIKYNIALWPEAIKQAEEFVQYYFNKTLSGLDLQKAQDQKKATDILLPLIAKIADVVEKSFWLKKLATRLDIDEAVLKLKLQNSKTVTAPVSEQNNSFKAKLINNNNSSAPVVKSKNEIISDKLLALVLQQSAFLEVMVQQLLPEMLETEINQNLYKNLIIYYTESTNLDNLGIVDFGQYLAKKIDQESSLEKIAILELLAAKDLAEFSQEGLKQEGQKLLNILREDYILRKRKQLQQAMQDAEARGDEKQIEALTKEFNQLI